MTHSSSGGAGAHVSSITQKCALQIAAARNDTAAVAYLNACARGVYNLNVAANKLL
jgi:hypothetical protein